MHQSPDIDLRPATPARPPAVHGHDSRPAPDYIGTLLAGALLAPILAATPSIAHADGLPDFRTMVEQQDQTVVSIRVRSEAPADDASGGVPPGLENIPEEYRRFFEGMPRGPGGQRPGPRRGMGLRQRLHRLGRRLHPDQRPRRRRRRRDPRGPGEPAPVRGRARRLGPDHRRGAAQGRRHRPAGRHDRRLRRARRRAVGARDRLAVRARAHRHAGHRLGAVQKPAERQLRPLHPDRRRGQPRQLGRAAVQHRRRGRRHQLADLLALGRLPGPVVRDSDQHRDGDLRAAQGPGLRHARLARRDDPGRRPGAGRVVRARASGRGAGGGRHEGQPGRRGRRRDRRHHRLARRARRAVLERAAAAGRRRRAGHRGGTGRAARRRAPHAEPSPSSRSTRSVGWPPPVAPRPRSAPAGSA